MGNWLDLVFNLYGIIGSLIIFAMIFTHDSALSIVRHVAMTACCLSALWFAKRFTKDK